MYLEGGLVTETQIINNTASFGGGGVAFADRGISGFAGGNLMNCWLLTINPNMDLEPLVL